MSLNPLDNPGSAFEVELLNPNPSSRRTQGAPRYFVRFEVDKAAHDEFMASRESNLRLLARCVVLPDTDEEEAHKALTQSPAKPKREPKAKKAPTPYGKFWELLYAFHNRPDVRAWLGVEIGFAGETAAKQALRDKFGVQSRSEIAPDALIEALQADSAAFNLAGAITACENANAKAKAKAASNLRPVATP